MRPRMNTDETRIRTMLCIHSESVFHPCSSVALFDQNNGMAADGFGAADVPDPFAGLGLHVHRVERHAEQLREARADRLLHRAELRLLREDRDIHIHDAPPEWVQ